MNMMFSKDQLECFIMKNSRTSTVQHMLDSSIPFYSYPGLTFVRSNARTSRHCFLFSSQSFFTCFLPDSRCDVPGYTWCNMAALYDRTRPLHRKKRHVKTEAFIITSYHTWMKYKTDVHYTYIPQIFYCVSAMILHSGPKRQQICTQGDIQYAYFYSVLQTLLPV